MCYRLVTPMWVTRETREAITDMPTTEEFNRRLQRRDYTIVGLIGWIVGNLLVSAYLIYTVW